MAEQRVQFEAAGGERRRDIVAAAQRCVARKGVHGTTMRDIARQAGMSASTVYRYFGGKADVLRYLADGIARSDAAAARRIASTLEGTSRRATDGGPSSEADPERLWELVQPPGGRRARDEDHLRTELWAEASRDPDVAEVLRSGVQMVREALGNPGDASISKQAAQHASKYDTAEAAEPDLHQARLLSAAFYGAHMLRSLEANSPAGSENQRVD